MSNNRSELKILSDSGDRMRVAGYGMVFGGQDLSNDRFTAKTATWLGHGLSATPPVLFGHGQDETFGATVLGHVVKTHVDGVGIWIEAQLEASKRYLDLIRQLIAKGIPLGWSSGSIPHLVQRVKSSTPGVKEITVWPVAEWSLVTQPCEPRTLGVKELKALALHEPQLRRFVAGARKAAGETSLQEASYEDLQGDLAEACAEALSVPYVCVCLTYPDHVIVSVDPDMGASGGDDDEESAYWDFPYTIGDDGEPTVGTPKPVQQAFVAGAAKATLSTNARNNLSNSQVAYVDSTGGTHLPINDAAHVRAAMDRFNQTSFENPAKRKTAARKILARARALGIDISSDSAVAMAAKDGGKSMDLSDSAFAFIEAGTLDTEMKTMPRTNRHYPHHDADGNVDVDQVRAEVQVAMKATDSSGLAHLLRHLHAAEQGTPDDAHSPEWTEGASPKLLVIATKMIALAEAIAADRLAMERLGLDTKSGGRLNASSRMQLSDLHSRIGYLRENADGIERGDDGTAQVDLFRAAFDLLALEEVA